MSSDTTQGQPLVAVVVASAATVTRTKPGPGASIVPVAVWLGFVGPPSAKEVPKAEDTRTSPSGAYPWSVAAFATGGLLARPAVRARKLAISSRVTKSFGQ